MSFSSGGDSSMSEINVTPLVDVMLVLLIIFMVTAPMMQSGIPIDLPQGKTKSVDMKDDPIILSINKEGKVYFKKKEVALNNLEKTLLSDLELMERKQLYIRADEKLEYGKVIEIMSFAKSAGVKNIGLVTRILE